MNNKGPILVLLLVSVGLGVALIVVTRNAGQQSKDSANNLAVFSNTVVSDKKLLSELQTVNQTLETNLSSARVDASNKLAAADANLRANEANLERATAEAKAEAKALADSNAVVLAQRDQRISDLESQNGALDKEAAALRSSITNLDARIAETQEKLAKSEGDRGFLSKQLRILKVEKANMEKRFSDLIAVRDQLRQMKIENSVSRRLESRREKMYASFKEPSPVVAPPPAVGGANVELRERGGVRIQLPPTTNAPPK